MTIMLPPRSFDLCEKNKLNEAVLHEVWAQRTAVGGQRTCEVQDLVLLGLNFGDNPRISRARGR